MTHLGAIAAATTCRSPLLTVYHSVPVSSVIDKQWYEAWAHLQQPAPAASPTGSYMFILLRKLVVVVIVLIWSLKFSPTHSECETRVEVQLWQSKTFNVLVYFDIIMTFVTYFGRNRPTFSKTADLHLLSSVRNTNSRKLTQKSPYTGSVDTDRVTVIDEKI